jgi:hypothetical protein
MNVNEIKAKLQAMQTQNSAQSTGSRKNNFYKPSVGKEVIRVVPSKFNKSNPFSELMFHYGIHKFPIISPINFGDADPIVEFVAKLREAGGQENWRLARKLEPKMRVFASSNRKRSGRGRSKTMGIRKRDLHGIIING